MKIVLLHYAAPPVVGGVESVIGHHARLMADAGHEVSVIAGRGEQLDPRIPFLPLPLADSRHPEVLAVKAVLDRGEVPTEFQTLVEKLTGSLHRLTAGVDILIAHNVYSLNKNLALTAAIKNLVEAKEGPRVILWHHDLAWTTPRYLPELHEGEPWDLLRTPLAGVTHVTVSEARQIELSDLLKLPPGKIIVIPNGIDIHQFHKLEETTQMLVRRLELFKAEPLILLPVRITPRKNIEYALNVVASICQTLPHTVLVVTGPLGPHNPENVKYFERLRTLRKKLGLESSAHFLAEVSDQVLPDSVIADFYHLSDLLLLPSREEGFGIPLLEAGLAGIPIFCADIPPLRTLGQAQVTYFRLDSDPAKTAGTIAGRMEQDQSWKMRVRVRQEYTWEGIYDTLIAPLLRDQGGGS